MTFLLLLLLDASPAVKQYLTGKVPDKHRLDQRQLLLQDVFVCNEQSTFSLAEHFKFVHHCLLRRIIHCDSRRRESLKTSLQTAQLSQNKSRTYCTGLVHQGVDTNHQHQTLNIQILRNFIIHIDFLSFEFEWYSQVYHGLSVSEYNRDGGRNTTHYTGRRLPWTMLTTNNTAVIIISTFAHLKFQLHLFYSSTKWGWYANIKGVYTSITSDVKFHLDLHTAFQIRHRLFKKASYHFLQSDFKQIIISHDSIVDSNARIVVFDGPGSRSPNLFTILFNRSIDRKTFKTTTFHVYIEIDILSFEATEPSHIHFSQAVEFDYRGCDMKPYQRNLKQYRENYQDGRNTICSITRPYDELAHSNYFPLNISLFMLYIHEGPYTKMPGYNTPKCQYGGLYYVPNQNKALCSKNSTRMILYNDGSVQFILIVWFSGYSRGVFYANDVRDTCMFIDLDINYNNTILIDTNIPCQQYTCPDSTKTQHQMCKFIIENPDRPVGSSQISVGVKPSIDDCVPGLGTDEYTALYNISVIYYTDSRLGYNKKKRFSDIISKRFKKSFQYLVGSNVSIPGVCLRQKNARPHMKLIIASCRLLSHGRHRSLKHQYGNVLDVGNCFNETLTFEPPSIIIKHENYKINYSRHHIITSYHTDCASSCRNHSFDLKVYHKFMDRVDIYSAEIGEKISPELNHQGFWIKIRKPETPCPTGKCYVQLLISDQDDLSDTDLTNTSANHYNFHNKRYV